MMGFQIVVLWSDMLIWLLVAAGIGVGVLVAKTPPLLAAWRRVGANRVGMAAATVLLAFIVIGLLDSLHYRVQLEGKPGQKASYAIEVLSVLDALEVGRTMHSWSLDACLSRLNTEGRGVVVLLNCGESADQLLAQFEGTARASHGPERGRMDLRTYGVGAQILRECGVHKMNLMGNPRRLPSMAGYGLEVVSYVTP